MHFFPAKIEHHISFTRTPESPVLVKLISTGIVGIKIDLFTFFSDFQLF